MSYDIACRVPYDGIVYRVMTLFSVQTNFSHWHGPVIISQLKWQHSSIARSLLPVLCFLLLHPPLNLIIAVSVTTPSVENENISAIHPFDSALDMARAIIDGTVTSRELVEMFIERIERLDGELNAVIDRDFDAARRNADKADEQVRRWKEEEGTMEKKKKHELGVFHGVPMTIKESLPTPGFRVTNGDPWSIKLPKWTNAEATRGMLENGGAILLGKTNQPINAADWEVNNPLYGRTGNPYDLHLSPGGSSGGSAAALAAGLTPMEIGTDIAGSVRIPAVMCGVVGHLATREISPSLNPQFGIKFIDGLVAKFSQGIVFLARAGPMARNAEDVIAMLEVFVGAEAADTLPRPTEGSSLADYRVAIWGSSEISPAGTEVSAAIDKAVMALEEAGCTVEELEPPTDLEDTYKIYLQYLSAWTKLHMPLWQKLNARKGRAQDSYPLDIKSPFAEMDNASVNGIPEETQATYDMAAQAWDDYLKNYDAILGPIFPREAWPNESKPYEQLSQAKLLSRTLMVDGEERYYGDSMFWSHLANLFGLPVTGFPVDSKTSGLPVGLQAIGAKNNDFIVLDVVQKLMKELGRDQFQPPPGFV
jgi:amidase